MPDLVNSHRQIQRATLVSIRAAQTAEDQARAAAIKRPLAKASFIRTLRLAPQELDRVKELARKRDDGTAEEHPALNRLVEILSAASPNWSNVQLAMALQDADLQDLTAFGRLLATVRRSRANETATALGKIQAEYVRHLRTAPRAADDLAPTPQARPVGGARGTSKSALDPHGWAVRLSTPSMTTSLGDGAPRRSTTTEPGVELPVPSSIEQALAWAVARGDPNAIEIDAMRRAAPPDTGRRQRKPIPGSYHTAWDWLHDHASQTEAAVSAFAEHFSVEPIGRLHLERMEMTPVGLERGELAYSIPLTPRETVNISHREWALRSEELETIVQDMLESYSEEGVTEKNDLAQSTESQQRHTSAFSLDGNYSYYGASVSIGYDKTSEDQESQKDSRQHSSDLTRKASARAKKEHKHSFRVTSVVGSDDQSVRVITNPSDTEVSRVDYYQLMRKWRVDLFRYGLRMTYDIVIPSPGLDLMEQLDELRSLNALIDAPFTFDLTPASITRDTWDMLAIEWGGDVGPPPEETDCLSRHAEIAATKGESEVGMFEAIEFSVDERYTIESASFTAQFGHYETHPHFMIIGDSGDHEFQEDSHGVIDRYTSSLTHLNGRSGELALILNMAGISVLAAQFTLRLRLRDDAYRVWQLLSWRSMRDAAEEAHYANRQSLIARREALSDLVKSRDALTLRRMEREEIMKGVLRWLLGPDFELVPADIAELFEPIDGPAASERRSESLSWRPASSRSNPQRASGSAPLVGLTPTDDESWERVIRYGEMIRFLHNAIEWENVVYFTYPYFWDSPTNWPMKRFLQHPDPTHQEFLRAGSARVVLTVRPGYELDFASFVEIGQLGDDHPYTSIATEIQNFAATNYAGIRAANPVGNSRPLLSPRQQRTWRLMQRIIEKLEEYKVQHDAYPTTAERLDVLNAELPEGEEPLILTDLWGSPFEYRSPGVYAEYELASLGADGAPGGEGEDADITSWADASLIGRWYEYTPTSALDISLNTALAQLA